MIYNPQLVNTSALVSIIIPVYKVEKYIAACIESIIAQTYGNIEIILIDDGSPDNSGSICDEYAMKDKRIKVIHNQNQGVSAARKCGVKNASGEWLCFIDSDDTIPQESIYLLFMDAIESNSNIIVGYFNNDIPIHSRTRLSPEQYLRECVIVSRQVRGSLWGKLYHSSLFDEEVMNIPKDMIQGQDMLANVRLAVKNEKEVLLIPYSVYNYRDNNMSTMHTFTPTLSYVNKFSLLLSSYIPNPDNYKKELLKSKINSLHLITRKSNSISWKNSTYYKNIRALSKSQRVSLLDNLLLYAPRLYLLLFRLYNKLISINS